MSFKMAVQPGSSDPNQTALKDNIEWNNTKEEFPNRSGQYPTKEAAQLVGIGNNLEGRHERRAGLRRGPYNTRSLTI